MRFRFFFMQFYCGIKSGIPPCCVVFFGLYYCHAFNLSQKIGIQKIYFKVPHKYEYNPCPICLLLNRIRKIKECDYDKCMEEGCYI